MVARQGRTRQRRRAAAAIWALVTLTTMLTALALALNASWLATAKQELGSAADAAALAGANELMNDTWLRPGKPGVAALLQSARESANEFAGRNRVLGRPLQLDISGLNNGDIMFGSYDPATPKALTGADLSDLTALTLNDINTVAVTGTRTRERGTGVPMLLGALVLRPFVDMRISSLAYLDRDVIGFRARAGNPIPLAPIAVSFASWQDQIRDRNGPDDYHFNEDAGLYILRGDEIPEIDLVLQLEPSGDPNMSNAAILTIGTGHVVAQITEGVTERNLRSNEGRLVLGPSDTLTLPGTGLAPPQGTAEYLGIVDALKQLMGSGAKRVWPLMTGVAGGQVTVNAFVAARVVRVTADAAGPLVIRLQPTLMAVPQAITDYSRRKTASLLPSEYLARPRLAR